MKPLNLILAFLALAVVETSAATKFWNGSTAGSWQIASNWIPAGVQVNGDALVFANPATKLLTTNAPTGPTNFTSILILGNGYRLRNPALNLTNELISASPINSVNTILTPLNLARGATWTAPFRPTGILTARSTCAS